MPHPDEGQLTCLLDGELTPAERTEVEAHLAGCAECRALLDEIRAFSTEADGLVQAVELPRAVTAPTARPASAPPARRPLPWRTLAWAATVMLAVGLGYVARGGTQPQVASDIGAGQAAPATTAAAEEATQPAAPPAQEPRANQAPAASPPAEPAPPRERAAVPGAAPAPARDAVGTLQATEQARAADAPSASGLAETAGNALASRSAERREAPAAALDREATAAKATAPVVGFHQVTMEQAVRTLGGQIRLVDGLTPRQVLAGPGSSLAGARADVPLIRVVYEDPPGRELWLDQQRTVEGEGRPDAASGAPVLMPGDTILAPAAQGMRMVRWMDQAGFRLALTGFLPADSLRTLLRRVE